MCKIMPLVVKYMRKELVPSRVEKTAKSVRKRPKKLQDYYKE